MAIQCLHNFNRILLLQDCHPLPLQGVVGGTRTRKHRAYLVFSFIYEYYLFVFRYPKQKNNIKYKNQYWWSGVYVIA